jgi:hypothetical protein
LSRAILGDRLRIGRNVLPGLVFCLTEKGSNERPRFGLPDLWGVDAGGNKRGPDDLVGASYGYSILATSPDASYPLTHLLSQRFLPFCGPLGFGFFAPSPAGPFLAYEVIGNRLTSG